MGLLTQITGYLEAILNSIAGNLWLSVLFIFLVCVGEAVFIVGLLVPSLPILLLTGGLIAAGKLPFWEIYLAAVLGAIVGDAISPCSLPPVCSPRPRPLRSTREGRPPQMWERPDWSALPLANRWSRATGKA